MDQFEFAVPTLFGLEGIAGDELLRNHPEATLTANQEKRCRCGNSFTVKMADGTYRAYSQSGEFLMLAKVEDGVMSTIKSFFDV